MKLPMDQPPGVFWYTGVRLTPFDASGAFRPEVDDSELQRLAIRGAGVTVLSSGVGLAVQVVATVVLARLLTPADFGLVAMITTFSLLLMNVGLNGLTEAMLQRGEIDHALSSNLFWISVGAGLLLTLGFAASGSLLARFYHDPLITRVAVGMSLTILIASTSVQHLALLKRAMRFSVISANDIVARVISVVASVGLAWAGWGYWALVAGAVAQPLAQSIGAWVLCRWIPGLPRRVPGTASMVRFAVNVYGHFSVNYFARNADNLLVGWCFGAQALGLYKKAYDLFALSASQLTAPLTNVAVSALSRLNKDPSKYKRRVLSALAITAFVGMGVGADLTLVGTDVIRVLLGTQWEPAGRIFTFFGPGIGIMLLYYTHGWIHLSLGKAERWFRWGLVELAFTGLLFILGLHWGPVGVAAAWTASFWILTIPALRYAAQPINLGIVTVFAAVWRYVVASLLAGGAAAVLMRSLPLFATLPGAAAAVARIVTNSSMFVALYVGAVVVLHGGFAPLYQIARVLREMVRSQKILMPFPALAATHGTAREAQRTRTGVEQAARSKPLVSILIPAFNAQEWIADTLHSALAQTWESKEIIVVDDGSTDQTLAVARQFESDCVRVVTQKNQGAAAARNKAFSLSRGDYIQWLDADDLLAPDKIAKQIEALEQCQSKRTLLSSAWGMFMYRHSRAKFVPTSLWCDLSPGEWLLRKMEQNLYMQTATWLVSRQLIEAAGPWDRRLLGDDDGEYFCRVLLASDRVRFVPEAKVYYRGPGLAFRSLSYLGQSAKKLDAHWLSMQLHIGYLRSLEDSERVRAACLNYLRASLIYFYPDKFDIVEQVEQMASDLGGQLGSPRLSWKYSWMKAVFGWHLAARGRQALLSSRWFAEKIWDKALFRLENQDRQIAREGGPTQTAHAREERRSSTGEQNAGSGQALNSLSYSYKDCRRATSGSNVP